jgi:hypothetical protein
MNSRHCGFVVAAAAADRDAAGLPGDMTKMV